MPLSQRTKNGQKRRVAILGLGDARADGAERIEPDGTLIYTEDARRTAQPFRAELAEPLSPEHWESRLGVLRSFYEDCLRTAQKR